MSIELKLDRDPTTPAKTAETGLRKSDLTENAVLTQVEDLSDEEKHQVQEFAKQIDISDSSIVRNYGTSIQEKSKTIASSTLSNVKTKDTGAISDSLIRMVVAMSAAKDDDGRNDFLSKFFRKVQVAGKNYIVRRQDAEKTLENIEKQLVGHQLKLTSDIKMLERLWNDNWEMFKALTLYIKAAEIAIEEARAGKLAELQRNAEESGKPEDAMLANKFAGDINRFEKRVTNLRLTRTICLQSAPQINMLMQDDEDLVDKLQSSIINSMSICRSQIAMSIAAKNNLNAATAANAVDDFTNEMLRRNAEQFHIGVVESAKAINRQIVDTDTIEYVTNEIVSAVVDYIAIENESAENRRNAVAVIAKSEHDLVHGVMSAVAQSAHGSAMTTPAST